MLLRRMLLGRRRRREVLVVLGRLRLNFKEFED